MTKAQKALLGLLGHNLFSAPFEGGADFDWRAVIEESRLQSVTLLAFGGSGALPVGEENAALLKPYLKKCALGCFNSFRAHEYLHALMTKHAIPYCILKGVASARYYRDPLLRNMGDVDFYVEPGYWEAARDALVGDGFEWKDNGDHGHIPFKKGAMYVELHSAPIGMEGKSREQEAAFLEYWSDLCERACLFRVAIGECVLPSDFHHCLILLSHFRKHLLFSGVGLRHVCDWAVFADAFSNEEFLLRFEPMLKRLGLFRLGQLLSLVAVKHLGMPHKPWMGEDYETADALLEEVLRVGNFGRSTEGRAYENFFISGGEEIGANRSRFFRLFRSMNRIVRARWPVAGRCPLLYPVGWVYLSFRFLLKVITGKRKVNVTKAYRLGGERLKLYKRMGFFDGE